jgi:NADPH:quinone reductase-like Zn-dependent oxidoreductase
MRAVTQHRVGGPEVLEVVETAAPEPGPGEVRITTRAIGVNPVDAAVRAGAFPLLGEPPFVLGWDVAGVVDALGDGVTAFAVGDRVFGMPRFPAAAAAYAEQVVAPVEQVASIPDALDDEQAAALPLVGLTAWQALVQVAAVGPGQRVLVPAAGGGVGHVAVQLALALGAEVVATASPRKAAFVRGLGVSEIVDYTTTDLSDVTQVDVALDPFGGEQSRPTLDVVKDGGILAVLVGELEPALVAAGAERGVRVVRISVQPDAAGLAALVSLVEQGRLTPHVEATFPLEKAGDAHVQLTLGVQGKLVLVP